MIFEELEHNISSYLLLQDKGIVKLLCATVIANRMPELDPTWLFIVSNSSGGKSELLSAMSFAYGCFEQDDLTAQTFISGAKKAGVETSLIYRLPTDNPIMVMKDLTLLLNKDPKASGPIFDQLRLIYDGKLYKSFGTGEDVKALVRMGLIAGVTSAIETLAPKMAALGERAMKYYMLQPDRLEVTRRAIRGKKDKEQREMMGQSFKEFLDQYNTIPDNSSDLSAETYENLTLLAEMATSARSSVTRKEYDRNQRIERKDLKEMPIRMGKQLANLGKAMMVMNNGSLTSLDNRILYKIALDSIPSARKDVMMAATKFSMTALDGLAKEMKLPEESVKIYLDDLIALEVMEKEHSYGANKSFYRLREDYRLLISKFEDIPMTNEVLEDEIPELRREPLDTGNPGVELQTLIDEVGI